MTLKLGLQRPLPFPVGMLSFVGVPRLTGVEDVSEGLLGLKIPVELEWGRWLLLEAAAVLLVCAEVRGRGALGHRPCSAR